MSRENAIGVMSFGAVLLGIALGFFAFGKNELPPPAAFLPAGAFLVGLAIGIYLSK